MMHALCVIDEQDHSAQPHISERIADVIVERIRQHGQCSIMDVRSMGFSLNDIARYWPDACRIAERENSKWRILND